MSNKSYKNNTVLLFFYRLIKVIVYRFFYDISLYKFFYLHKLQYAIDFSKNYKLVICHNGGGGTVSYMKNKYKDVPQILILRNTVSADKDYLYSIENTDTGKKVYIKPRL